MEKFFGTHYTYINIILSGIKVEPSGGPSFLRKSTVSLNSLHHLCPEFGPFMTNLHCFFGLAEKFEFNHHR